MNVKDREVHVLMGKGFLKIGAVTEAIEEFRIVDDKGHLLQYVTKKLEEATQLDQIMEIMEILEAIDYKAPEEIIRTCADSLIDYGKTAIAAMLFEKINDKENVIMCGNKLINEGSPKLAREVFTKAISLSS